MATSFTHDGRVVAIGANDLAFYHEQEIANQHSSTFSSPAKDENRPSDQTGTGCASPTSKSSSASNTKTSAKNNNKIPFATVRESLMCEYLSRHATAPFTNNAISKREPVTSCWCKPIEKYLGDYTPTPRLQFLYFASHGSLMLAVYFSALALIAVAGPSMTTGSSSSFGSAAAGAGAAIGSSVTQMMATDDSKTAWLSFLEHGTTSNSKMFMIGSGTAQQHEPHLLSSRSFTTAGTSHHLPWYERSIEETIALAPNLFRLMSAKAALNLFLCSWYRHPIYRIERDDPSWNEDSAITSVQNHDVNMHKQYALKNVVKAAVDPPCVCSDVKSWFKSIYSNCYTRAVWIAFEARTRKGLVYASRLSFTNCFILVLTLSGSLALAMVPWGLASVTLFLTLYVVALGLSSCTLAMDLGRLIFFRIGYMSQQKCPMLLALPTSNDEEENHAEREDINAATSQKPKKQLPFPNISDLLNREAFTRCSILETHRMGLFPRQKILQNSVVSRKSGAAGGTTISNANNKSRNTADSTKKDETISDFPAGPSVWEDSNMLEEDPLLASFESDKYWRSELPVTGAAGLFLGGDIEKGIYIGTSSSSSSSSAEEQEDLGLDFAVRGNTATNIKTDGKQEKGVRPVGASTTASGSSGTSSAFSTTESEQQLNQEKKKKQPEWQKPINLLEPVNLLQQPSRNIDVEQGGSTTASGDESNKGTTPGAAFEHHIHRSSSASSVGTIVPGGTTAANYPHASTTTSKNVLTGTVASISSSSETTFISRSQVAQHYHMADGTTTSENGSKDTFNPASKQARELLTTGGALDDRDESDVFYKTGEIKLPIVQGRVVARNGAGERKSAGKEDEKLLFTPTRSRSTRKSSSREADHASAAVTSSEYKLDAASYRHELRQFFRNLEVCFVVSWCLSMLGFAQLVWYFTIHQNATSQWVMLATIALWPPTHLFPLAVLCG
ncbi:unnamed protein product [Amoebophrya sp. A120]|nr:unnamed protein product [Amoebophrya sp. A120]|eukprot:GSA120T00023673001.1